MVSKYVVIKTLYKEVECEYQVMIRVSIESLTLHLVVHSWASWFHREFVLLAAVRRFPGVLHLTQSWRIDC